jgi:hypothetical protein
MDRWIRQGIEAYQSGNRPQARRYFKCALMEKPEDVSAWLWLVEVADNTAEKQHYLEQVIRIDPNYKPARDALDRMALNGKASAVAYVNPFDMDEDELSRAAPAVEALDLTATPPFVPDADQEASIHNSVLLPEAVQPVWRRQTTWVAAGLVLTGIAAVAIVVFLMIQMAG